MAPTLQGTELVLHRVPPTPHLQQRPGRSAPLLPHPAFGAGTLRARPFLVSSHCLSYFCYFGQFGSFYWRIPYC